MAIIYKGPSMLDGSPIVAIATLDTKNPKTGDMIQVWILREDISPVEAVQTMQDASICGDCPQRHNLGGACYVQPFQAPLSVWKAYKRGNYDTKSARKLAALLHAGKPIRLGAYGDPAAVPLSVWDHFVGNGERPRTGYTHQWRNPAFQGLKDYVMASCDTMQDAIDARAMGWRYFRVMQGAEPSLGQEFTCMSERDTKALSCADCRACDGTNGREKVAASVTIQIHGARSKNFRLNVLKAA
jgi:hypothetical protein